MTDKEKQYLIAEIERLKDCASPIVVCDTLLSLIDSMQEDPCDGCTNRRGCITCENGELRETMQKEPVSDELEKVVEEIVDPTVLNVYGVKEIANRLHRTMIDSASEELEEEIENYLKDSLAVKFPTTDVESIKADVRYIARHFAQWGKNRQEPVSDDFKQFEKEYLEKEEDEILCIYDRHAGLVDGAQWKKEQFEKNRLKHCNSITNEQAELEQGFIDQHFDKYQRMPTFLDAIEYGMRLQKQQMMKDAINAEITYGKSLAIPSLGYKLDKEGLDYGDKVKVIIIKK